MYEMLGDLGAAFGEKSGWERPNWFDANAADGDEELGAALTARLTLDPP